MTELTLTKHARTRLQQRGLKAKDIELIAEYGETIERGLLMTAEAVDEALADLRNKISRLEKLKGRVLITDGEIAITTYRANHKKIGYLNESNT
ncbi:DUF4258 domain-containing protein [Hyphomonadaceae bacterium ML37]|nr:DUF4258 domain-containing protein [Hyphomonadaceae bacterium ML37]